LFSYLIGKRDGTKLNELISLFTKKAQKVGEELLDNYIEGNLEYLDQFEVALQVVCLKCLGCLRFSY